MNFSPGEQSFRTSPPPPAELRPFRFPEFERFTLQNGLPVIHAPLWGFPVVALSALFRAGATQDGPSRAGLASLAAGLLDAGAGGRSAAEIADALEMVGLQLSVGTSWDHSEVSLSGINSKTKEAADLLTLLVRSPDFPESEVERLRGEHLAAVLQRRADPRALANETVMGFTYAEHSPFSKPANGSTTSLAHLTRSDIVSHHRTWFTPDQGAVIVAGAVERREIEDLLGGLADWDGRSPSIDPPSAEPRFDSRQVFLVHRPGSVQSEIRIGHVAVSRSTPDYFPLVILNTILGGAFTSRLNLNLRERHGFTYGVSSAFAMRRHPGPFLVSTAVQTEVTAAAVREIFNELSAIQEQPVTASELVDARNYVAGVFPLTLQTANGVASRLADLVLHDLPDDYFNHYPANILAVTDDQVHRVAREHLAPERAVVVVVGDAHAIRQDIEALDLGPVEIVDPAALS